MLTASQQQLKAAIDKAWAEAKKRLLPAELLNSDINSAFITRRMEEKGFEWTGDNLLEVIHELDSEGRIIWYRAPVPAPAAPKKSLDEIDAEFRAKEIARIQREKIENSKPFSQTEAINKEKEKEAIAKLEASAAEQINSHIQAYECYSGPGRRDWAAMSTVTEAITKWVSANPKSSRVFMLQVVKEALSQLPDRPKLGDTEKIINSVLANRKAEISKSPAEKAREDEEARWRQRPR